VADALLRLQRGKRFTLCGIGSWPSFLATHEDTPTEIAQGQSFRRTICAFVCVTRSSVRHKPRNFPWVCVNQRPSDARQLAKWPRERFPRAGLPRGSTSRRYALHWLSPKEVYRHMADLKCLNCGMSNYDWLEQCGRCGSALPACGETQTGTHDWTKNCERCSRCGRTRTQAHDWSRVDCETCLRCGETRAEAHDWTRDCDVCAQCGKTRTGAHNWCDPRTQRVDLIGAWSPRAGNCLLGRVRIRRLQLE
jgi:hypothetical protein